MNNRIEFIRALTPIAFGFFAVVVSVAGIVTNNRDASNIAAGFIGAAAGSYIPNRNHQPSATAGNIENITMESSSDAKD